MVSKELGKYLRQLRKERAVGLKQAAPKIGVSYTYLSKLETGGQDPSDEVLAKLAHYYDVDTEVLGLMAGKLPDDILTVLQGDPTTALEFLRRNFG
jgi:transcriptional regulator with XRE-family HTH domain